MKRVPGPTQGGAEGDWNFSVRGLAAWQLAAQSEAFGPFMRRAMVSPDVPRPAIPQSRI